MRLVLRLATLFAAVFLGLIGACLAEGALDPAPSDSENLFLDRLMLAESGGRLFARNPRSGAYGPFQFLSQTFLDVVKRNFPAVIEGKTDAEILELRASAELARNAALLYTRENARYLADHGSAVTPTNLRLAFFAGPGAAQKVLTAKAEEALSNILSGAAIAANPFMARMTAGELIEKSAREAEGVGLNFTAAASRSNMVGKVDVRCNLKLASCRHWLALAQRRMGIRRVVLGPAAKEP
jgi:hypothetical protein